MRKFQKFAIRTFPSLYSTCLVLVAAVVLFSFILPAAEAPKKTGGDKAKKGETAESKPEEPKELPPARDKLLSGVSPHPVMVLWHKYISDRTEVLDFSGHGSLGEFRTAPLIPTRNSRDWGLKFLGNSGSGPAQGYRIMESEELTLDEGTISFWIWAEPGAREGVVIACEADKKKKITVHAKHGRVDVRSTLTGGKSLNAKAKTDGWVHVAVTFGPEGSALWLNGKKKSTQTGAGRLDDSKGLWVGHDSSGKKGFSGVLEDLMIYKKALATIEDAAHSPESRFPPGGLVLHYDFQDKVDNPVTIKDRSGNGLDGQCASIVATGVSVRTPLSMNRGEMAWRFRQNHTENATSVIVLPKSEILDLPQGTMVILFCVEKMTFAGDPRSWMFGVDKGDGGGEEQSIDLYHYHPNNFRDLDPGKVEPFTVVGPLGRGVDRRRIPMALHNNEWMKLVVAWNGKKANIWVNNMRLDSDLGTMCLWGSQGFITLGARGPNDGDCLNGLIADFRIYSYKLPVYSKQTLAAADEKSWKAKKPPKFKKNPREKDERFMNDRNKW